ncbi:hypothetical protein B0H66DRAFT_258011 [Apodospora peruviana]|uniref:Uncharacterized protein n=1 Tax=Apodospora peruviana TaxID=516989 RepID=A0AAE0M4L1_9PEZI|nr:hypothetical protein B0H66DRAFT_258011 [Apodospora peruviana]
MVHIVKAAKAAIAAYASAVSLAGNSSITLSTAAAAMANLYLPGFTAFTLGSITPFPNATISVSGIAAGLARYNRSGLGTDIRYEHARVDAISNQSAICWITWKLVTPRNKPENVPRGWSFTDVYGFWLAANPTGGLEGGWEWSNSEDEYEKLLETIRCISHPEGTCALIYVVAAARRGFDGDH